MILKGSQRGSGQNLAVHLMRTDDNEHVRLHELRGFSGNDLREAFKETEAVSRGTRCRQYLFSLSLNPPEDAHVSVADFESAIDRAEGRLGLTGQPRAVVFHEKEGRRHAHCVWSRIDAETMTARPMSFFKAKLNGLSRDLYLDHGWEMPRGLAQQAARDPTNFTLAEWQQAKRQGVDPRWLKAALQECWKRSDDARAFGQALKERGFHLARGDRRGFVVVDHDGTVHSLPRALALKTKEVRDRLGDVAALPSVADAQRSVGERMTPAIRRHIAESRERFEKRSATLGRAKEEMTRQHRAAREALDARQREERQAGTKARAERLPRGLAGLWHRLTGKYQQTRAANEAEAQASCQRQESERERLVGAQRESRAALQAEFRALRQTQAEQLATLRREVGRFLRFSRGAGAEAAHGHDAGCGLQLTR
ncbi:MAG: relaxase/mobilization nuclease domain-containing protein [Methylorubrum rhodinum]|uniref:relaxase/mobilization nuclease domain-containing protein n=1 Tax=Methylorubrum rhodinum TaxID=29428 RepID=UPI003BB09403